ncbi:ADP-heptose:LPS heptosyl transferase I [Actinobacillus equuli]|nr:ADP-heptose:LPS heptosyl transferase I [Actinobacillus equuli]
MRYVYLGVINKKRESHAFGGSECQCDGITELSLTELAEQIAGAKAVLSVDTGLSHLAAALDKQNVILYGATDPKLIGAYGKNQHYLTGNGMANILPYRVLQTLETLITE